MPDETERSLVASKKPDDQPGDSGPQLKARKGGEAPTMIWVGSFKSLLTMVRGPHFIDGPLKVHTWVPSQIALISPLVDWVMSQIMRSSVHGEEQFVELALREALSNAMLHGNGLDPRKLVHVRCCCEWGKGVLIIVRDQGHGFDPSKVPDPLAFENLGTEHGRGIHLMKLAMDQVSFERGGSEVHMRKISSPRLGATTRHTRVKAAQWLVRPSVEGSRCRVAPMPIRTAAS
jgi:serine/threonine-protein kinase RsbW